MEKWSGKVAIVTGASAGIGSAICIDLIKANLIVIGLARRPEKVEALKHQLPTDKVDNLHALKCDVTQESDIKLAFEWITKTVGIPHILINNAGVLYQEYLLDIARTTTKSIENVLQTNIMGTVMCTRQAFQLMKENNIDGHIIIMNSVSGHTQASVVGTSVPTCSVYSPSKFALTALTEVIRQELEIFETNIKVTVSEREKTLTFEICIYFAFFFHLKSISPGFVKTDITDEGIFKEILKVRPYLDAEDVSAAVLYVLGTPPHVQV